MGFCTSASGQQSGNKYQYQSPLGPSGTPANTSGNNIFNYLSGDTGQSQNAAQNYASALGAAASNPGWGTVQQNAVNTAAGDYLQGSPALNEQMAQNEAMTMGQAAGQNARTRANYQQNGMGFSTANQEAQQANTAAAQAQANQLNAQTYATNYLNQLGAMQNAGSQLAQAVGTPLSYLGAVPSAYTSGLTTPAAITQQLGTGGTNLNTGGFVNQQTSPSLGGDIMGAIGSL